METQSGSRSIGGRSRAAWELEQERRRRNLSALLRELEKARHAADPWYRWLEWRNRGEHRHDLKDERGRAIACPVGGCDAVRGSQTPHTPGDGRSSRREPRQPTA